MIHRWVRAWTVATGEGAGCGDIPEQWLSADERLRCRRIRDPLQRERSLMARALLGWALEMYGGVPRERQNVMRGPYGRPELAHDVDPRPSFSISHTDGYVAVALATVPCVGIDIERLDSRHDYAALAEACLSAEERRWVALARPEEGGPADRFVRIWTAKEAVLKAIGRGLSVPLPSFTIRLEPFVIEAADLALRPSGRWHLRQWREGDASWAALAFDEPVEGCAQVQLGRWQVNDFWRSCRA